MTSPSPEDKNVLVITYDFPPRRTSATYRLGNITRSLLGRWHPTVLTIQPRPEQLFEPEQFEKISQEIRIERTRFWLMGQWEGLATKAVRSVGVVKGPAGKTQPSFLHRTLRRLAAFVRSCLYFPDYSVGWVPFALIRGFKLLRKHRFDVIFSSEPPRSASVVALLLRMIFRVPWVFELMDPWYPPARPWRRRIERWFLGSMLRRADAVVVMTEGHRQDLHENFGISSSKFFVIPNGFDEADFGAESSALAGQTTEMCSPGFLHFSHFGTVYPRNAGQFFPGLNDLLRKAPSCETA